MYRRILVRRGVPFSIGMAASTVMIIECRPDKRIEQLLHRFDLTADPASVCPSGDGIVFRFREPRHAARVLENSLLFARGRLGVLHGRQIGGLICEYRSY